MIDIYKIKSAYLIGIKGVGMTALAQILVSWGVKVSGSDTKESFFTDLVLKQSQISVAEGFTSKNIPAKVNAVIYSQAYNETNPEVSYAQQHLPTISYTEALAQIFAATFSVMVAGTHGKSTTTALLGWILKTAGKDPTVLVGTKVPQFQGNALVAQNPKSNLFVAEADEYQAKLLRFSSSGMLLTSCEYDHPDFYPSFNDYRGVFIQAVKQLPANGFLVYWGEEKGIEEIVGQAKCAKVSYGFKQAELMATDIQAESGITKFQVKYLKEQLGEFSTLLLGRHNVLNCLGAIGISLKLGIAVDKIKQGMATFQGTTRRCEVKGEKNDVLVIDDYGHHPTEVKVTLAALKERYPDKRLICVFHPHTFSRTQALFNQFAASFTSADLVIVLAVYSSAREKLTEHDPETSAKLVSAINKISHNAIYQPTKELALNYLEKIVKSGDLLVTMGAGDVWQIADQFLNPQSSTAKRCPTIGGKI